MARRRGVVLLVDRLPGADGPGVAHGSARGRGARADAGGAIPPTPRAVCLLHDSVCALDRATDAVTVDRCCRRIAVPDDGCAPCAVFGGSSEWQRRVAARTDVVPTRPARH